jgi:hypothetical protein
MTAQAGQGVGDAGWPRPAPRGLLRRREHDHADDAADGRAEHAEATKLGADKSEQGERQDRQNGRDGQDPRRRPGRGAPTEQGPVGVMPEHDWPGWEGGGDGRGGLQRHRGGRKL